MGNASRQLRAGLIALALVAAPLTAAALQAGDTAVDVPAAQVSYKVPGAWEKLEPHDAGSVCSPTLHSPDGFATIDVEIFPNEAKKTWDMPALKAAAELYAATMQEIHGGTDCEVSAFDSDHHLAGYRIHYISVPTHLSGGTTTYQNSIYIFTGRDHRMVFVTYTAEEAHFSADVDTSIRKTITLSDQ